METNPMDYLDPDEPPRDSVPSGEQRKGRLNALVAITVALLATFMGICKLKDQNIVQQMQQDQAKAVDAWGWFQAKKTRLQLLHGNLDQLEIQAVDATPAQRLVIDKKSEAGRNEIEKANVELKDLEKRAVAFEADYDAWNRHDDQFDLAEALLSVSISLLAVTSLTQKRWLFKVALAPMVVGVIFGLAGLFHLGLHSDLFAKWLGT